MSSIGNCSWSSCPNARPVYRGRSANTVNRMRGYLLAAFEDAGLPEEALPYVFEELESRRDAYLVAAAAEPFEAGNARAPTPCPSCSKAIENIKYADDAVSFDSYRPSWPLPGHTTALKEIAATIAWLGSQASSALPALRSLLDEPGVLSEAPAPSWNRSSRLGAAEPAAPSRALPLLCRTTRKPLRRFTRSILEPRYSSTWSWRTRTALA